MGAGKDQRIQALPLRGQRLLLVEDEYYIADDLKRTLAAAGAEVIGPFGTVDKAREAILAGGFDGAVVDLNLRGETAVPIADRLVELGVPFAIATGYGPSALPERLQSVPRIEKPFQTSLLVGIAAAWRPEPS